jgi:hypothetical protein
VKQSYLKEIKIKTKVWLPSGATPLPIFLTSWIAHFEFTDPNYVPHSMNHPVYSYREYQMYPDGAAFWRFREEQKHSSFPAHHVGHLR